LSGTTTPMWRPAANRSEVTVDPVDGVAAQGQAQRGFSAARAVKMAAALAGSPDCDPSPLLTYCRSGRLLRVLGHRGGQVGRACSK